MATIRVVDYGAYGNGETDDTTRVQFALDAVSSPDDIVILEETRVYRFSKSFLLKECTVDGLGATLKPLDGTHFDGWQGNTGNTVFKLRAGVDSTHVHIQNFICVGNGCVDAVFAFTSGKE